MDSFGPDDVDTAAETRTRHPAVNDGALDEYRQGHRNRQKKLVLLLALGLLALFLALLTAHGMASLAQ